MYYIYRHIRLDNNTPFYIGVGTCKTETRSFKAEYSRAFCTRDRNKFWNSITSKTNYEVEIIFHSENREIILEKEIEFIKLYGRRNLGTGTLVNLTAGGFNAINSYSIEQKEKWLKSQRRVPVYQYSQDGNFVQKFNSLSEATLAHSTSKSVCALKEVCNKEDRTLYGYKWFYEFKGDKIQEFTPYLSKISKNISVYKNSTKLGSYSSIKEVAKIFNLKPSLIRRVLNKTATHTKGYTFS